MGVVIVENKITDGQIVTASEEYGQFIKEVMDIEIRNKMRQVIREIFGDEYE